jgi:hypothetical protein
MPPSRERISALILELLGAGPSRTAREIAAVLRSRAGLGDVERRDVNSVLYLELSGTVVHDAEYRWFVPPSLDGERPGLTAPDLVIPGPSSEQGSLFRTIHRLRSGLPPTEHLEELTVAPDRAMAALRSFLSTDREHRWVVVAGDYGHGKSHTLYLIRDLAERSQLATCYLSADGYGSALNHPQRFLHTLLSTMEVPGRRVRGYEDLLHELLLDEHDASRLRDVVLPYLLTGREVDREVNHELSRVISALQEGDVEGEDRIRSAAAISYYLSGQSIAHRGGADARQIAYILLRIAVELVKELGATRLVVIVDEAESIYTKLSPKARQGAYRVLAALCESPFLGDCSVGVAMTPDACRELASAARYMDEDPNALGSEPVRALAKSLTDGSVLTLQCRALRPDVRRELLDRVKTLYERAYPGAHPAISMSDRWRAYARAATAADVPVRVLVRQAVDFLDGERYRSRPA